MRPSAGPVRNRSNPTKADEMSTFDKAVKFTLEKEGVLSDDANDRGGLTKFGIIVPTLRTYQAKTGQLRGRDVASLTKEEAIGIYRVLYWRYDGIAHEAIAIKLFDYGVNVGLTQATIFAQRACNTLGRLVTVDGLYGPATMKALNELTVGHGYRRVLDAMLYHAAKFYIHLVDVNHTQMDFIGGWLRRAADRP
jgi:lysozyme family protein